MSIDDSCPPVRRPRRSNTLKDIRRLLGAAGTTVNRKDRLATTAGYLVRSVEGACSPDLRRHVMELGAIRHRAAASQA